MAYCTAFCAFVGWFGEAGSGESGFFGMGEHTGVMTTLGLGAKSDPAGEVSATFRVGWLKHFRLALSSAGGAAVVLGLFELLQRQPAEGFKLLSQWGPWPVIALVALVLVGGFMSRMNETVQTTFGAVVTSVQQQAQASSKTAEALGRLADQGGRQFEEVRRLAIFNAQEFPGIYARFDRQDEVLQKTHSAVAELVTQGRKQ